MKPLSLLGRIAAILLFLAFPRTGGAQGLPAFATDVAPTFTVTETLNEAVRSSEGSAFLVPLNDLRFVVTASMNGINPPTFNNQTDFLVSVGSLTYSATLGEGTWLLGGTSCVINLESNETDANGDSLPIGSVSISWNASRVRFVLDVKNANLDYDSEWDLVARSYAGLDFGLGDVREDLPITFQFADRELTDRMVYLDGEGSISEKTFGQETFDAASVRFSGGFDTEKPVVNVNLPLPNATVFTPTLLVQGDASDNINVEQVLVSVNGGPFGEATGASFWSASGLPLNPGANSYSVKAIDQDGNESNVVTRNVTYSLISDLTVAVAGEGAVTSGFVGTTQRPTGSEITLTATPAAGWEFAGWTGSIVSGSAALTFVHQPGTSLVANFAPGPFIAFQGVATGIASGTAPDPRTAGYLSIEVSPTGKVVGSLLQGGVKSKFNGGFKPDGTFKKTIQRPGLPTAKVSLVANLAAPDGLLTGTMKLSPGPALPIRLHRSGWNATTNPAPQAGTYTAAFLAPSAPSAGAPEGHGYGTVTVDAGGQALVTGTLADGTRLKAKGVLSGSGVLPVFKLLNSKKGILAGELKFRDLPGVSDFDGSLGWTRLKDPGAATFKKGFVTRAETVGSRYVAPAVGSRVFPNNSATASAALAEGGLAAPLAKALTLSASNVFGVSNPGADALALAVDPATGWITGSFVEAGKTLKLGGVVLQKQNGAAGFFLNGKSASGSLEIATP